ncbi:MAG: TIGR04283 family arsenosugar biosynthesis glycosyltransferase [Cyclobacteriaceae bacterium]
MEISVIIPTFNEEKNIGQLVKYIFSNSRDLVKEVIVVDGQSEDRTVLLAQQSGARVLTSPIKSRATQMNLGAEQSSGSILYFVHADIKLIDSFATDIEEAIQSGNQAGCYRFKFDSNSWLLKANAYCTRFNGIMCRGGDQTMFIRRDFFFTIGGFDENFIIMEDYDIIQRIRKNERFKIIPKCITVSSRKYNSNSWPRVQIANLTIFIMYFLKRPSKKMASLYKRMLNYG